ncbi:MAG: acyl carrier protein [Candidatus Aenigmatarchaeota archaeon]
MDYEEALGIVKRHIERYVQEYIEERFEPGPDTNVQKELKLEPVDYALLLGYVIPGIERETGLDIADEDFFKRKTVGRMAKYLSKLKTKA